VVWTPLGGAAVLSGFELVTGEYRLEVRATNAAAWTTTALCRTSLLIGEGWGHWKVGGGCREGSVARECTGMHTEPHVGTSACFAGEHVYRAGPVHGALACVLKATLCCARD